MATLLVKNIQLLVTMDDHRREIENGGFFVRDGFIEAIGNTKELPETADEILDLTGYIVLPGLVNTHHHFYQTLTRVIPDAQNVNLFNWLKTLYPIWGNLTPEDIRVSTKIALAELALSGCTTASDHLYIYPNGSKLDDEILAAREVGLRLHATRGSMSLGQSKGGLPPDSVVESEDFILKDSQRLIEKYHNPEPGAMTQIALAPCSPFSVSADLMKETKKLADEKGIYVHTHLAETKDEEEFCVQRYGYKPVRYMQELGWLDENVWFAHAVYVDNDEIELFKETGSGVAHCPSSNMRLASGIAPIMEMIENGVKVSLGVDGSASNDGSNMLEEIRQALLVSRVRAGLLGASKTNDRSPAIMTARQALEIATIGGANVLGRKDIGSLEKGKAADFFAINLNNIEYAGAMHDPVAALVMCAPVKADYTVVGGRFVVKDGELQSVDLERLIREHNQSAKRLVS